MAEPMTDERLAEIREMHADYQERHNHRGAFACCSAHPVADTVPDLLAEVARSRVALDESQDEAIDADVEATVWHDEFQDVKDERDRLAALVRDLIDPDPCSFDHNGGCQAHGYLDLKPGEKCPHAEAKELLAEDDMEAGR